MIVISTLTCSLICFYLYFLKRTDVGIINGSPISMGLLTNRGPPAWHPATQEIREACKQAAEYCEVKVK